MTSWNPGANDLFLKALQLTSAERQEYLDGACAGDVALRAEVESLLEASARAGTFLDSPASAAIPTADQPSVSERPGTVIGPYKLLEQIGEGGFGVVFMAEQTQPVRRKVALKIIKPGMDTRQVIARFEAERQALAIMDHPNIAKVYDGGATGEGTRDQERRTSAPVLGRPYFVMELVKGVPITRYCDEHRLTPRQRLELFVPVCQAIQHAHHKGVIHRDIKPSNVLVALYDDRPVPKVIDFGVAKATGQQLTEATLQTGFGAVVGTLEYMSPEQASSNQLDVDTRSDIYSLGVLLYELLTGSPPFSRKELEKVGMLEMLRVIREQEPSKPSTKLSTANGLPALAANRGTEPKRLTALVRGELDWIVMKALEKDRSRRYETANSFAMDLQRYLADEPVQACPPSAGYRFRKFVRRHKGPVTAGALIMLALLGGIIGTTWGLVRAELALRAEAERAESEMQARKEAQEQASITQAVNAFVQNDLLGQADVGRQPAGEQGRDREVKVRTLLDRAAQALERRFADAPLTEAAVRLTVGNTYLALGEYAEARRHLERSVQLRAAHLGADHLDTLESKLILATLHIRQGNPLAAGPLLAEVLHVRTAKLGPDHPDTLTSKHRLANWFFMNGQHARAEPLLREVEQSPTARLSDVWHTKRDLAELYLLQGKEDRAEQLLQEVVQKSPAVLGADHPDILMSQHVLASIYLRQGKYDRAGPLLLEVIKASEALRGPDHPDTLRSKDELAVLYTRQGKNELAEALLLEVLAASTDKLGSGHGRTLRSRFNLGKLYLDQEKFDRAETLFRAVVDSGKGRLPPDFPEVVRSKFGLAVLYTLQNKFDEAETLLREVWEAGKTRMPAEHPEILRSQEMLGMVFLRQGKPDQAEPLLRETLAKWQKKDPDSWATSHGRSLLGSVLLVEKKYADAEPLLLAGYEGMKRHLGREPKPAPARHAAPPFQPVFMQERRLLEALERVVQLYDAWGKPDQADEWRTKLEGEKKRASSNLSP